MIIFNAGVADKSPSTTNRFHRLLSYYYLRTNKRDRRELKTFVRRSIDKERK